MLQVQVSFDVSVDACTPKTAFERLIVPAGAVFILHPLLVASGQMLKKIAPDGTVMIYLGLVEYEIAAGITQPTSSYVRWPG